MENEVRDASHENIENNNHDNIADSSDNHDKDRRMVNLLLHKLKI